MAEDDEARSVVACCPCAVFSVLMLAMLVVFLAAYASVIPVRVTVEDAYLGSLALAEPAVPTNGTVSVAYNFSLAVALSNRNWVASVWVTAPLVAELRFCGHALARAQLWDRDWARIPEQTKAVYTMAAGEAKSTPLALGPDGAAEFARERAAGVFELELAVAGELEYEARARRCSIRVTCPLKLSPFTEATAPELFATVECVSV